MTVFLLIGIIPRMATFRKDASQTLADLAPDVIAKWKLGALEFEFVVGDSSEDIWRVVPRSTLIADVPAKGDSEDLGVRAASYLSEDPVPIDDSPSLFNTLSTTQGRRLPLVEDPGTGTPYRFIIGDRREQTLCFESGAKVLNARQRLAQALGVPEDAVSLLLAGRALKDTFLLSRFRVGNDSITVCVRDETPVILVTARAFRH
jgi:hypothetical protein